MTSSITRQAYIRKKAPLTAAIPNFVLKKLFASTLVISSSILVSACGGGGGSSSESGTDGTKSLVKQEMLTVAVFEGETKSVNLLEEGCNDSVTSNLTYNDSQTLPENYNFTDNVLTIDLTTTNIDDGADTTDLFELTCSTHVTSKKGNLSVTKQDLDSDALMTHVIDLPIAITTREHFAGSITLTDTDMPDSGVLNDRYTFDIIDTSNESSVFNGTMTTLTDDSESSRIYSISIDVDHSDSPIDAGSYRFQTQAITPVITGYENEQSDVTITHSFEINEVVDNATVMTEATLETKTENTINTTIGTFSDADGVQNVTVSIYSDTGLTTQIASNADGDFTGLTSSTTYYVVTEGEAYNELDETWEFKQSAYLEVTTDLSDPTISMADQTATVNIFSTSDELSAPTITNVYDGAIYSIEGNPIPDDLVIDANSGVATYDGEAGAGDFAITYKVTNPDSGNESVTFTLTVE